MGSLNVQMFQYDREGESEVEPSADAGVEALASSEPHAGSASIARRALAQQQKNLAGALDAMRREQGLCSRSASSSSGASPVYPEDAQAAHLER